MKKKVFACFDIVPERYSSVMYCTKNENGFPQIEAVYELSFAEKVMRRIEERSFNVKDTSLCRWQLEDYQWIDMDTKVRVNERMNAELHCIAGEFICDRNDW